LHADARRHVARTVFLASDLPEDLPARDRVLLAAMGSPDPRQIDGLGGAHPLTSKAGIVSRGTPGHADLDFTFAQLQPNADTVDTTPNCGNMLAAVLPFAIERGLIAPQGDITRARVLTRNTGMLCDITIKRPVACHGSRATRASMAFPAPRQPSSIFSTPPAPSAMQCCPPATPSTSDDQRPVRGGSRMIAATLIDNGMPMVLMRAEDLDRTGYESVAALNADHELKQRIEAARLAAGKLMGLGDVSDKSYPKMCLLARPRQGGSIATRCFIRASATMRSACWPPSRWAPPACCRTPWQAASQSPASGRSTPSASSTRPASSPLNWKPILPSRDRSYVAR
jgi:4-oxalomesaconate tautomerase